MLLPMVLLALPARAAEMLADTDLAGETYRTFELIAPVPDFCRKVCEKDEGCRAWTFSWPGKKGKRAQCLLKRSVSEKRQDTCCISGYKKRKPAVSFAELTRRWLGGDDAADTTATASGNEGSGTMTPQQRRTAPATGTGAGSGNNAAPERAIANVRKPAPMQPRAREAAMQAAEEQARLAEKRIFCRQYARTAIAANRQARALGCGFRGGLWGASFNGYFNWCMRNPRQAAERNTQRRSAALQQCNRAAINRPAPRRADQYPPPEFGVPPVYRRTPPRAHDDVPPPAARALQQRAPWLYSWLKRSGPGPRATPWRPSLSGKCPLVRACDCPQGNTCRVYAPGAIAVSWPLGCDGPPAYMVCRVRRR